MRIGIIVKRLVVMSFAANLLINCKSLPFFYFLTFEKADCSIFALSVGWLAGWSVDVTINFLIYTGIKALY